MPVLDREDEALAKAVNALYRIRAVEQPPGPDGIKEVWHQCAAGADLVSFVNARGAVIRQELTLLSHYFRWTSTEGLATGASGAANGSKAFPRPGEQITLDRAISKDRIRRAHTAFAGFKGEDKYLLNVQRVLAMSNSGFQLLEEPTVTHVNQPAPPKKR